MKFQKWQAKLMKSGLMAVRKAENMPFVCKSRQERDGYFIDLAIMVCSKKRSMGLDDSHFLKNGKEDCQNPKIIKNTPGQIGKKQKVAVGNWKIIIFSA